MISQHFSNATPSYVEDQLRLLPFYKQNLVLFAVFHKQKALETEIS